jgi:hypothetical protein
MNVSQSTTTAGFSSPAATVHDLVAARLQAFGERALELGATAHRTDE